MSTWSAFRRQVAGKWQFPLLLVSLACLAASLVQTRPRPSRLPVAQAITQLESLVESGVYEHALELGELLLTREDCGGAEAGAIHRLLARSQYAQAARRKTPSTSAGQYVVDHYRSAESDGAPLTGDDLHTFARALEWQSQFSAAVEYYQRALVSGVSDPWDLSRYVLELRRDRLATPPAEMHEKLVAFLRDVPESRVDLRFWALQEQIEVLEELGRLEDAAPLLAAVAEPFAASDFSARFEYLEALRLYKLGGFDEAELRLRALRNRLSIEDEVYAMSGWLLGRTVLSDGTPKRPLEAMSFFQDVIRTQGASAYAVASRIGMGEALALLERHEEAIGAYELALSELDNVGGHAEVSRDALAVSLAVASEAQRQNGHLAPALEYARLAARLVDRGRVEHASAVLQQLADTATQLAEQTPDAAAASALFTQAGQTYLEIARLNTLTERRAAEASWQAAEAIARSGDTSRAVKLFEQYTLDRPGDPLVPRAWLRMGELRHKARQLHAAIDAYQECYRRFPRTLDGARALVPLARCYLSLGADQLELAEKTLRIVLEESEVFTPQAPEFADALFMLGDVLSRRGQYEKAIATIEEAMDRYADDPRVGRARFLLADAYRRSGLALRDELSAAPSSSIDDSRMESMARLTTARELFRQVLDDFEVRPEPRDPLDAIYQRHAYLYEADCLFEMQDYRRALALYEEAAGRYRDHAGGLAAYVQIINCHVFLGAREEARAALARALVLVEGMPQDAFERTVSPQTRGDWREYFVWLGEAGLF